LAFDINDATNVTVFSLSSLTAQKIGFTGTGNSEFAWV